jgi:hypothetical protein
MWTLHLFVILCVTSTSYFKFSIMPPKSKPLAALNVNDPEVKSAYRAFTAWIASQGLRRGAEHVLRKCGGEKRDGLTVDTILEQISGLNEILPVYIEAVVALCAEERKEKNPLEWWRKFVKHKLKPSWFDGVWERLPTASMNLKKHDSEYYSLENQDWAQTAAVEILTLDFMMDDLLATQGTDASECEFMKKDIVIDSGEMDRRIAVYEQVAEHRLGANDTDYNQGLSVQEVREMMPDEQADAAHFLHLQGHRNQTKRTNSLIALNEDADEKDHLAILTETVLFQAKLLEQITHVSEVVRAGHSLLKRDLRKGRNNVLSIKQTTRDKEPAWYAKCDSAVYALTDEEGMKFESKGVTESSRQQKGRKMRDDIYKQYASLWDDEGYTWVKMPEESKIAIANACGQAPIHWNPDITSRRLTNYIAFRRSGKGRTRLNKGKNSQASGKKDQNKTRSHVKVPQSVRMLTLCSHYVCILKQCAHNAIG